MVRFTSTSRFLTIVQRFPVDASLRRPAGSTPLPGWEPCRRFLCAFARSSLVVAGFFSRLWRRSTQEARLFTTGHIWAPADLRGLCSVRPQSHEPALFHGILFRLAEPRMTMETHAFSSEATALEALSLAAATVQ